MAVQTDFMVAVNQIAAERGIDSDFVVEAIRQAIETGFKKDTEEEGQAVTVEIDPKVGTIAVIADKKVVEEVSNISTQISLKDAQKIESKLRIGDHIQVDITPEGDFGRVAAQAAKQVILQKIREAEKEAQIKEFEDRVGEVESAIVQRMDGDDVLWEINKATAIMKQEDRVPTEFYKSGIRHKVLLKGIEDGARGKTLYISRSDPAFLKALFELEIPELVSGSIEIKAIAREAGSRSKIAVYSNVDGIDPIGSCVGQKGVRINAIMNELKVGMIEEKVDIILWDESEEQFISNALSPAQTVSVKALNKKVVKKVKDEDKEISLEEAQVVNPKIEEGNQLKVAKVIVPDEQLSLAIGKDGQNVRLAAKLTTWKIDIQGETVKVESQGSADSDAAEPQFDGLELSTRIINALGKAGISDKDELKEKLENKEKIAGIGPKAVEEIEKALA